MTLHREHRAVGHPVGTTLGSWCAWGAVALVALWSVWWILPRSSVEPTSMAVQVVLPLAVHVTAAAAIGWGLWRRYVPPTAGQLALLALGAAVAMESVALLLVVFPPVG